MRISFHIVLLGALVFATTSVHSIEDFPAQVGINRHGQTINVNGHLIGISRQSHEHDDISVELLGRAPMNPGNGQNVQSRIPMAPNIQQTVRLFRDSDERHDISLEDMFVRQNNRQLVPGQQRVRPFRDSDERHDFSIEDLIGRGAIRQNVQSRKLPIQPGGNIFMDSDENDVSDEVNLSLLPELLRLLQPQVQQNRVSVVANQPSVSQPIIQQRYNEIASPSLEFKEILSNPTFQQKLQEIDERLKRAPAARGKRLMEKYATALAIYSSPSNAGSPSINLSHFLPLFIACFWVWHS
ncbi:hypothetical protein DAPPUDRAFT_300406 [Daphnia pulex]|uniref:Uncharacterized protein n=1 Tax=Daphnia pulex TaxID=6669 RepID=E9G4K6_DAPPU|nr:hypothetical protein DAPPUDRAFT_300406 [Daphnia pulex]|eukprot:EFX85541.1 hypothetical protein DAPPUDRAFT_300406 [Daphnia pulex]